MSAPTFRIATGSSAEEFALFKAAAAGQIEAFILHHHIACEELTKKRPAARYSVGGAA